MLRVAYKIAQLRKSRHLTQQELADIVGTTQQNISRLEDLENTQISISTLTKLAIALKARVVIDFLPR
ncbi:MAG: helix-turn-helix transcriptional regulator [Candidatus Omnitrophica bacterium]|nr:helix-turn-helix transcriptional regulator [Candidatus Omnitrophota bacterium]